MARESIPSALSYKLLPLKAIPVIPLLLGLAGLKFAPILEALYLGLQLALLASPDAQLHFIVGIVYSTVKGPGIARGRVGPHIAVPHVGAD